MGQRQSVIKHDINHLQLFSNSFQSVFGKKQTDVFIIQSDKEVLFVLSDIRKDVIVNRPIFLILQNQISSIREFGKKKTNQTKNNLQPS